MSVSRLIVPSAVTDELSSRMLMPPEPEYFWANIQYGAVVNAQLRAGGAISVGLRTFAGAGNPMPDSLGNPGNLNPAGVLSEAINVEQHKVGLGSTIKMNRTVFLDTVYTEASRDITRKTIGTTAVDLTQESVSITIKRAGGPYNTVASAVGPTVIEEFDLQMTTENLVAKVEGHLRRDRMKYSDTVLATKVINAAPSTAYVYPGDPNFSYTTDVAAFLSQNDRAFDLETVYRAVELALTNKIPTFGNGRYAMVLTPRQERQLKTNSRYEKAIQFHADKSPIYQNYIGSIGRCDIFVSQTNPTTTTGSITVQQGVLFGPGLIGYVLAKECQIQPDDNTNFGQRVMLVWQCDEGSEILDNRFALSLRSN